MLSIALQSLMLTGFIGILVLVWRLSKRPGGRIRAVLYGWGASVIWTLLWAMVLPKWFRGVMDPDTLVATFPDGTWPIAYLLGGWCYPLIVVALRSYVERTGMWVDRREGLFSLNWPVGFYFVWGFMADGPAPRNPWVFLIWLFAWWGVSLPFAFSALWRGGARDRIYAGISVAAFVCFAVLMVLFRLPDP